MWRRLKIGLGGNPGAEDNVCRFSVHPGLCLRLYCSGRRALAAEVFLNTPDTRYHVEDGIIYCYKQIDAVEIRKDERAVFTAPDGFRIVAFDVARVRGIAGSPRQWAGAGVGAGGREEAGSGAGARTREGTGLGTGAGAETEAGAGDSTLLAVILENVEVRLLCIYSETVDGIWFYKDMTPYRMEGPFCRCG